MLVNYSKTILRICLLLCIVFSVSSQVGYAKKSRKKTNKKTLTSLTRANKKAHKVSFKSRKSKTSIHKRVTKAYKRINKRDDSPNTLTIKDYSERIKDMISSVEFAFNVMGDDSANQGDKTAIITSSYLKFFRDDKVQIEDDLDESRKISIKKSVKSYLQDIDYFYKTAQFSLDIDAISYFTDNESNYFKIAVTRNLKGITYNDEQVNNIKKRYFEINLDSKKQDLKIVSIYSQNDTNQTDDNRNWWKNLPVEWVKVFSALGNMPANASDSQLVVLLNKEELNINGNKDITSLSPLYKFSKLKRLNAGFTPIANIDALRSLTQLELLNFDSTKINSIDALKYISGLKTLSIANTAITNASIIAQFTNLNELNIEGLKTLNSFSFLNNLKKLSTLNIANTNISSDSMLAKLNTITNLTIAKNPIKELKTVSNLIGITYLNIDFTNLSDLKALATLLNIETISCNNTAISDLDDINNLINIKTIFADDTKLSQQAVKKYIDSHLQTKVIFQSQKLNDWWSNLSKAWKDVFRNHTHFIGLPDKEQLHDVWNIKNVDISNDSTIYSLNALAMLVNIKTLNCNNTHIALLDSLVNCQQLENIEFSNTLVSNLTTLNNLPNLKFVNCNNT